MPINDTDLKEFEELCEKIGTERKGCGWCGKEDCNGDHKICGRCYDEVEELHPSNCNEKPEKLAGQPIGQYHCPNCGAMLLAGIPHPDLCKLCTDRKHPGFDRF
jgi:hypothetical protein